MRTLFLMGFALMFSIALMGQRISKEDNTLKDNGNTITGEIRLPRAFYANTNLTPAAVGAKIQKGLGLYLGNLKLTNIEVKVSATNQYVFKYSAKGIVPLYKPIAVKIGSIKHHGDYEAYFVLNPGKSVNFAKKGVTYEGCNFKVVIELKQSN